MGSHRASKGVCHRAAKKRISLHPLGKRVKRWGVLTAINLEITIK